VVAARNEARTVGLVVSALRGHLLRPGLAHELVVIDSDSSDDTAAVARAAGAVVHRSCDIRPDLGTHPGKGEALWKSQFVTTGDVLLFVDADLLDVAWERLGRLVEPLRSDPDVALVKARYSRVYREPGRVDSHDGGRLTELCARPLIDLWWPDLAGVEQPLAGEWAIRRSVFACLHVPVGYGVELAALLDVHARYGRAGVAQVDLGRRVHRHRPLADLGVTAGELLAVAARRLEGAPPPRATQMVQFPHDALSAPHVVPVSTTERPPARDVHVGRALRPLASRC
jgi:glucosyl-3-phosphoglycerate synthase